MIAVPFFVLPLIFFVGLCAGLWGYSTARRTALREYIAHGQRLRINASQIDAMGADFLASAEAR